MLYNSKTNFSLEYKITPQHSVGFLSNIYYIYGASSDMYQKSAKNNKSSWEKMNNLGGFNQLLFSFSICYNYFL